MLRARWTHRHRADGKTTAVSAPAGPTRAAHRSPILCVVASGVLLAGAAFAEEPAPPQGEAPPVSGQQVSEPQATSVQAAGKSYLLAPGDRVAITIFDQPEISGNYLVEPSGAITLPLIGPVDVTAFSPEGLQGDLVARFGNGYIQNPVISVRLSELRPFTIVGSVRAPGRYAYIDGMNVETAMALAGGATRLTSEGLARRSEFLQTDERLKSLTIALLSQLARKARIEAQLTASATIEAPEVAAADVDMMNRLIAGEREILTFESTSQRRQIDLLTEQSRQVENDIAAFTEQSELMKEQIAFLDDQIDDLQGLLVNGLTRKSAVIDLQREKSKSRSDLSRILSDLARSRSTLAEAEMRRQEVDTSYRSRLMTDLQDTKLRLAESQSGLPLVVEARQLRLDQLPLAASGSAPEVFKISRFRAGRIESIDADLATTLQPGDILQIGNGGQSDASGAQPQGAALPGSGLAPGLATGLAIDAAGGGSRPVAPLAGEPDRLSQR